MQFPPVDAIRIDAGLWPRISSQGIAFVDEDLAIDEARHHVQPDLREILCRKLRILLDRRLRISDADGDVAGRCRLASPSASMTKLVISPGAMAKAPLMRPSRTSRAGSASSHRAVTPRVNAPAPPGCFASPSSRRDTDQDQSWRRRSITR